MSANEFDYLDYFTGGVPAGALLGMNLLEIRALFETTRVPSHGLDAVAELSLIGLVAYFEAFCRDHFASLINICPQLITNLKARGRDVSIDASALLRLESQPNSKLGFLLAERYEFGTSRSVNALYQDLLSVTPFSGAERRRYEELLNDRNLLVHHGGIYTMRYGNQTFVKRQTKQRIFFDSLVVRRPTVRSAASFFEKTARKTMGATHDALVAYFRDAGISPSEPQRKATEALLWW